MNASRDHPTLVSTIARETLKQLHFPYGLENLQTVSISLVFSTLKYIQVNIYVYRFAVRSFLGIKYSYLSFQYIRTQNFQIHLKSLEGKYWSWKVFEVSLLRTPFTRGWNMMSGDFVRYSLFYTTRRRLSSIKNKKTFQMRCKLLRSSIQVFSCIQAC